MVQKDDKIRQMIARLDEIIQQARQLEEQYAGALARVHPAYSRSARNLIHYRALRMTDIRDLQKQLGNLGLSRLAKAEAHVMTSLLVNRRILEAVLQQTPPQLTHRALSPKEAKRLHKANAKDLLGYRAKGRRARIMVTLPSEAADDYPLVREMLARGMDCARINCAHDGPEQWRRMIGHVRRAARSLNNKVKVCMDLGGPKIRTGALAPGPRVRRYRPPKDVRGHVVEPLEVWLGPVPHPSLPHVPVAAEHLPALASGQTLYLRDARGKKRGIVLDRRTEEGFFARIDRTTVLETGMPLFPDAERKADPVPVGNLPFVEQPILLQPGDRLRLHRQADPGEPTRYDEQGACLALAHISCTSADVFDQVLAGEPILFDDGQIEGLIAETGDGEMVVQITHTPPGGGKLRADKGINLPNSDLHISGLTAKDLDDLAFIAEHADVVNVSFVNSADDVRQLIDRLEQLGAGNRLGIILKIETQRGFNNLLDILLEAMHVYPIGVMVARGDLAIETGWHNIGRVQEEILFLCRAAHISEIWATQVLENLAKKGIPSRAEITDAAMAQRADCVMLNKGPYIIQAIELLNTILKDLAPYQDKNAPMLPELRMASLGKKDKKKGK